MLQRSSTRLIGLLVLAAAMLALPSAASAANSCDVGTVDKTWEGDISNNWFASGNWAPGGVPGTTEDVCIPATNPNPNPQPVIGTGATANAASVESFQPIQVTTGTLRMNSTPQASLLHDDLDLGSGAFLDNRGSLTIEGNLDWSSATLTSGGAVGTTTIAAGGTTTATTVDSQRFINHQTLRINGAGTFAGNDPDVLNDDTFVQNGATLEVGNGGTLDLQGDQDIINNGGTGTNSVHVLSGGTLSRSSGTTTAFITATFDNDGTVSAAPASTKASPALSMTAGSGTGTSSGQFAPATGAVIDLGNFTPQKINGATIGGGGTTYVSSGNLDASGTNTVAAGSTLALTNAILSSAGTTTVNGTLDWGSNSTIAGVGTTTVASGGTLTAGGGANSQRFLDTGTLRINGSGTLEGQTGGNFFYTYLQNGAHLEVGSTGTLDLQDDQGIFENGGVGNLLHVLAGGTLTRTSAAGTSYAQINVPLDNDSTSSVKSEAGTLRLDNGSGGETSVGKFEAATGATIDFAGGTHLLGSGASFTGDGTILISGGEVDTSGTISAAAATSLALTNAILANAGTMTVNGTLEWGAGSTIAGVGTTTVASGGTLTAGGGANSQRFLDTGTLRINGSGTLEGQTGGNFFYTYLQNGAHLEVGSTGTLDLQDDQGIFENGGVGNLLHVLAGGTLTRTSAAGTSYAQINVPLDNDSTSSVKSEAGTLRLDNGSGGETSVGKFEAATGATIDFAGGTHLLGSGASFTGDGTILISGGEVDTSGTISAAAATSLALTNAILANAGTMTVNGTLEWGAGSTIAGVGTTTVASGGTLTAGGGANSQRFLDTGTLRINGSGTLEGQTGGNFFYTYLQNGAHLEVGSTGTLDLQDDQGIFENGGVGNLLHVLAGGTLTRTSAAGTSYAQINVPLDNDSTSSVKSEAGTLRLDNGSGGETSVGKFEAATGATIDFAGGTHLLGSGASLAGAGTILLSGGTLSASGATSVAAPTTVNLTGSTLANTGTMTVHGTLEWDENSTINGAGTTTIASDGVLTNAGGDQRFLDTGTVRIDGTATFAGDLDDNCCGDDLWMSNNAQLEIGSGGSLDLQRAQDLVTSGGAMSDVHVLSGGTLNRSTGTGSARIMVDFDNDGTIDVGAGTLALDQSSGSTVFANYNQATDLLSGGTYVVHNGSKFQFPGADVKTNGAEIILDGAGSGFEDESAQDGLRNLGANNAQGKLRLRNGRNFTRTGAFTNNGLIDLAPTTKFTATTNYTQGAGGTLATDIAGTVAGTSYGQLTAGSTASITGTLDADVSAYPPQTGDVFDVVTATTRTGTFGTVVGDGFDVKYLPDRVRLTPPSLTIANRAITEGDTGSVIAGFRVTLSSPSAATVTVDYTTTDGLAKAPADYTTTTGTLTYTPGQTSKVINVPVIGDTLDEKNERYNVVLSNPQFAEIADGAAIGTIGDNDPPPAISINDVSRPEGGAAHRFDVTLSAPSGQQVKVHYATANGTAGGPDYTATSGNLVFAPGQTTKPVMVSSVEDALDEADETFAVNLSSPVKATIADASGTGTITDDDPMPSLSINDSSGAEGGARSFTVSLSVPSGQQVRVDYTTVDATATAPGDYTTKSATLVFQPGQTSKPVSVSTTGDALDEDDETFKVNLSNQINATISDGSGTGTITDDDPTPTLSIGDVRRSEGANPQRFTISLSAVSGRRVQVEYATANGTAVAPGDYGSKSGSVTFQPGETTKTVTVNSVDDALDEPDESFAVNLSNPSNATIGDGVGTGTIVDNDPGGS